MYVPVSLCDFFVVTLFISNHLLVAASLYNLHLSRGIEKVEFAARQRLYFFNIGDFDPSVHLGSLSVGSFFVSRTLLQFIPF